MTAIIGIWYARYEGFNTLRSGMSQLIKNELPLYEIVSGAAIAFGAVLLIIPGFATDILGFFLIFPLSRKFLFNKLKNKINKKNNSTHKNDFIDGDFEDIDDDHDRKI